MDWLYMFCKTSIISCLVVTQITRMNHSFMNRPYTIPKMSFTSWFVDVGEGSKLKVQTFNYSILQQTFKKVRFWRLETFKSFKKVRFWRLETIKCFKNNQPEDLNYLSWRFLKVFKIFFKNSKNMKIVIPALLKMIIF